MRSTTDGGWEITTRAVGFSDHRAAGFPIQVPMCMEKQCKACPDPEIADWIDASLSCVEKKQRARPGKRRNDARSHS
ncbi:hypothetical protein NDU88_007800 [Pleurodeles waltl]|uniref:Uncharacterized protein n=1 Tax=Pleurodeles waltl TaxID=8319 RepID=A0AAV7PR16_PLEWA|nr:hypothetical protein NDU88_007800 [Pleurodeles waltl]